MLISFLEIDLAMTIVIVIMLIISKKLDKKYKTKWKYYIWLLIAIRLIIPINYTLPKLENNSLLGVNILFDENKDFFEMDNTSNDFDEVSRAKENEFEYYEKNAERRNLAKIREIIIFIWILAFICFLSFYILNYIIFKVKIKNNTTKINNEILDEVLKELNIKRNIRLMKCEFIESPMLVGFLNPTIYMPNIDYTKEEERIIYKHELTHFKRKDNWYKLILIIAKCIHWFNPVIHLMIKQANKDLEYSCDDLIINDLGLEERKKYSRIILKTMEG